MEVGGGGDHQEEISAETHSFILGPRIWSHEGKGFYFK